MSSILLKGGLLLDPASGKEEVSDLRIEGNAIAGIGKDLQSGGRERIIDVSGLWVCPGFIDMHCHLRDLGQKDKEDLDSGTRAAAGGGFTTVVAMANTEPVIDNTGVLAILLQRIEERAHIEVLPVAAVTVGLGGEQLTNMVELAEMGAVAFSDDGIPVTNMAVLRRALEYARFADRLVISHSEDRDLTAQGAIHEGATSGALGLPGIPAASETVAVAREIEIVRATGAPYHFTHLSCAGSVELVRRAKADGLPITADVTPHHLALTVDDITTYDTHYKMKPPLRTELDQAALLAGLKDGTIDAIATDHAPHTRLDKCKPMDEAAVGLIGLETAFAVTHERLVVNSGISKLSFISFLTINPARILNLPIPSLQSGLPANITLIDPSCRWTYDPNQGSSKSRNTPFAGRTLIGKPVMTIYRGKTVYQDSDRLSKRMTEVS